MGDAVRPGKDILPKLCSKCQSIFDHWFERDNWSSARPLHSHHHIVGLQASAQDGCLVCAMFFQGLSPENVQQLQQHWPNLNSLVEVEVIDSGDGGYGVMLSFPSTSTGLQDNLETVLDVMTPASSTTKTGKIQEIACAEENWVLIKKWLDVCRNTHTQCSQASRNRQLPTRLIEVGDTDEDIKLCQTQNFPLETEYLTLSHCWGGKVFTTLTCRNFQEFLSRIPADALTKTFREALVTTRNLGFKYIWIDSLCIIQGDEVDWRQEAARMETVYANSSLNIAASAAEDGDFGCFSARRTDRVYGCKVATRDRRNSKKTVVRDVTIENLCDQSSNSVLDSRAWVFQELFLAPRILCFSAEQLHWECISARACETFPDTYDNTTSTRPSVKTDTWEDPESTIAERWGSVVGSYSGKRVTFESDRLVAVSGVARMFAAKFGTTYLAGMWKEDLVYQLIWWIDDSPNPGFRNSVPSWSWAAVDTSVVTLTDVEDIEVFTPLVSILEATTTVDNDEFGSVKGGKLRIKCNLPFNAVVVENNSPIFTFGIGSTKFPFSSKLFPDKTLYSPGEKVYLLPMLRGCDLDDDEFICGIVIQPILPASYCRTGYFEIFDDDGGIQAVLDAQDRATFEDEFFIGEALEPNEEGKRMCIITLV